ncbi:MAG: hypothetical protein V4613_02925 [Bacteroidota bacterium]
MKNLILIIFQICILNTFGQSYNSKVEQYELIKEINKELNFDSTIVLEYSNIDNSLLLLDKIIFYFNNNGMLDSLKGNEINFFFCYDKNFNVSKISFHDSQTLYARNINFKNNYNNLGLLIQSIASDSSVFKTLTYIKDTIFQTIVRPKKACSFQTTGITNNSLHNFNDYFLDFCSQKKISVMNQYGKIEKTIVITKHSNTLSDTFEYKFYYNNKQQLYLEEKYFISNLKRSTVYKKKYYYNSTGNVKKISSLNSSSMATKVTIEYKKQHKIMITQFFENSKNKQTKILNKQTIIIYHK